MRRRSAEKSANPRQPSRKLLTPFTSVAGLRACLIPQRSQQIVDALHQMYKMDSVEATLEADPETITTEKAAAWLASGFNRLSLGAQSFSDRELQSTGRMHRCADIFRAVQVARDAGFRDISMDLIAGLPHQTRETWEESLDSLLRIRPEHISIYMLEIDEGSRLGRESLAGGSRYGAGAIPSDDAIAEFYEWACARLDVHGYEHYEISNWALPGLRSRHNLKYWRREPYIGFGAGAHSFDGEHALGQRPRFGALRVARPAGNVAARANRGASRPRRRLRRSSFWAFASSKELISPGSSVNTARRSKSCRRVARPDRRSSCAGAG